MLTIICEAVGNVQIVRFGKTGGQLMRATSKIKNPVSLGLASTGQAEEKPAVGEHSISVELSIVVPVYNESENIIPLAGEICPALAGRVSYELIFVNDGSSDNSFALNGAVAGPNTYV